MPARVVVEQGEALGPGVAGDQHGVLDGAVAPVRLLGELAVVYCAVVDQQVDAVGQLEGTVG